MAERRAALARADRICEDCQLDVHEFVVGLQAGMDELAAARDTATDLESVQIDVALAQYQHALDRFADIARLARELRGFAAATDEELAALSGESTDLDD
jgi:hypothetical protein